MILKSGNVEYISYVIPSTGNPYISKSDKEIIQKENWIPVQYNIYSRITNECCHTSTIYVRKIEDIEIILNNWNSSSISDCRNVEYTISKKTFDELFEKRFAEKYNLGKEVSE